MWAGTDEYEGEGILPSGVIFTSSSGSNRQSVAEHILAFTMALCRRLPTYREVSDYEVRNDGELSQAVNMLDSIIELLKGGYRVA